VDKLADEPAATWLGALILTQQLLCDMWLTACCGTIELITHSSAAFCCSNLQSSNMQSALGALKV
jgi:hypothetical protein